MKRLLLILLCLLLALSLFAQDKVVIKTCEIQYASKIEDHWVFDGDPVPYPSIMTFTNEQLEVKVQDYKMFFKVVSIYKPYEKDADFHIMVKDIDDMYYDVEYNYGQNRLEISYPDGLDGRRGTFFNINTIRYR